MPVIEFGSREEESGLYTVYIMVNEAGAFMEMMKARIRRTTRLEKPTLDDLSEVCTLGRMLYELTGQTSGTCSLGGLSREEIDILYTLPLDRTTEKLLKTLNTVRPLAPLIGRTCPMAADRVAKAHVSVMES